VCFNFLYNFYLKYFSFWEELSEMWSKMWVGLHVKCLLFLSGFNKNWIFSTDFRKILKCKLLWRFVHWERTDGRTDGRRINTTKAILRTRPKTISRSIQKAQSGLIMLKYASQLSHRHRQTVLQGKEKVIFVHAMKAFGEVEVWLHSF